MPPKESEIIENKRIPVPEHVEPEPEKRGFGADFFCRMAEGIVQLILLKSWNIAQK
jgi:hypothetical protein